jgi:hypothetical protein
MWITVLETPADSILVGGRDLGGYGHNAWGMGQDIPDIRAAVHTGKLSYGVERLCQEL